MAVCVGDRVRGGITGQGFYYKRFSLGATLTADKTLTSWRIGGILLYAVPQPALSNLDLFVGLDTTGEPFAGVNVRLGSW